MGYFVKGSGAITIEKQHHEELYEELMALNYLPDTEKRGGSYANGKRTAAWFSWMPADLTELPTVADVFKRLGFDSHTDAEGNLDLLAYDSKQGQEELFMQTAAPFVKDRSVFQWWGEDGAGWYWEFQNGRMLTGVLSRSEFEMSHI